MSRKIGKKYYIAMALAFATIVGMSGFSSNSFFGALIAKANGYYLEIGEGAPLLQSWTSTFKINTENNWSEIVSIEGFSGGNLSPVAGANPQSILADNPAGTKIVVPDQTDPINSAADGVAEFEITNPVVALKASDTATAPNLVIHLNTQLGCTGKGVIVNYNVRDIDASSRNSVTSIATQYRVGGTGNFTNVAFGNIADATTGPGQATLVTPMSASLPLVASGQPLVDVRIIATNATGLDEWVGIDDIRIECFQATAATTSIRGRVMFANGRGISKTIVSLMDTTTGQSRAVITNPLGYYSFNGLPIGDFYIVSAQSKRYQFDQGVQSFQLFEETNNLNFIAN